MIWGMVVVWWCCSEFERVVMIWGMVVVWWCCVVRLMDGR